jgi:translation elongation factor EF-1beta
MPRCAGIKPDNNQCERIVDDRSTYCYSHDPRKKEVRRRAASKAGKARSTTAEIEDVKKRIRELTEDVIEGRVDRGRASVAFQGLGVLKGFLELSRKVKETEVLEAKLAEIEQVLEHQQQGGNRRWG